MNKIYFGIVLHFHQPIGNLENVIERAYQLCYRPFLELLSHYPDIKMAFHISGCLLDYLEEAHPEMIGLIKDMVLRNQIEMVGGGYYEPIFPAIPERDMIGQIRMMSEHIRNRFGFTPQGIWIPERVWTQKLTRTIYDAGMHYSILDGNHFLRSGVKKGHMHGYFLTGQPEKKIAVFPSDKVLRYSMPFELPEKTIEYFKAVSRSRQNALFTYGDDGEKFGEWPGTHKWVFEEEWLRKFFDLLIQNSDWIRLIRPFEYLKHNPPIANIDIKDGSYEEMMEWSDGSWMNFLKKYPETNQMHTKMMYVSNKVHNCISAQEHKKEFEEAKKELYKGQCNCGYWHGVFGGLYLYHLRNAIYNHLINADKLADTILHGGKKDWLEIRKNDFDRDGKAEVIIEDNNLSLYVDPAGGGVIKEFDYRPLSFNLINTVSRKKEPYHKKILAQAVEGDDGVKTIHDDAKPVAAGTIEKLIYDKFPRYCSRDYFLNKDIELEDFFRSSYKEMSGFPRAAYSVGKKLKGIILKCESDKVRLSKEIEIKSNKETRFLYTIEKKKDSLDMGAVFGIEFNLTMPYLNSDRYNYFYNDKGHGGLNTTGSISGVNFFGIHDYDNECSVYFKFSKRPLGIWHFPVETVSQSERSYELNYQCSCIFPRWALDFDKNKKLELTITWSVV